MDQFDSIKVRHLNRFLAAVGLLCVIDAAGQLRDPHFLVVCLVGSVGAYFIGKKWQEGGDDLAFSSVIRIYWAPLTSLLASLLVLALGPVAVKNAIWLFAMQAVVAGFRLKAA